MSVQLTSEAELERMSKPRVWEYDSSTNYEEIIVKAKNLGWKEKIVQVRVEFYDQQAIYFIEPFERDCSCPHILKYQKAFPND